MSSYIPTKEADFLDWSANLITVSKANIAEWNLPEAQLAAIETLHNEAKALHEKCKTAAYTRLDMQAKNEKLKALKKDEEVFVRNNLQNNDAMTDNGRAALRIPIYDRNPTPHPGLSTVPYMKVLTPLPRIIEIRFRVGNAARWGKPEYAHGLECCWIIAESPPAKIEDLLHSEFSTRTPLKLAFDEDQRGKRIYFAARWENGTVKKGPWSDIFSAVIP
ncbi:MAG: hypothetical protein LBT11_06645 [Treponema sp.]|jgi:hypothetical protein|nr:hypothetical protein [Treponema sp.]